jgi:predicted  nucleic acid-binding Zn-ribbon protein
MNKAENQNQKAGAPDDVLNTLTDALYTAEDELERAKRTIERQDAQYADMKRQREAERNAKMVWAKAAQDVRARAEALAAALRQIEKHLDPEGFCDAKAVKYAFTWAQQALAAWDKEAGK